MNGAALAARTSIAAPLYMISRTDLWTEHLARVTYTAFSTAGGRGHAGRTDLASADMRGSHHPLRLSDLVHACTSPVALPDVGPQVTGHERSTPFYYFPPRRVVDSPATANANDWRDDDPRAPSGYAPEYARAVHEPPHQITRFRRGDTALVDGRVEWASGRHAAWHAAASGRGARAGSVARVGDRARSEHRQPRGHDARARRMGRRIERGAAGAPRSTSGACAGGPGATKPSADLAISDTCSSTGRRAAPSRRTVEEAAAATALTTDVVPGSGRIGVFWELYPARQGERNR